MRFYLLLLIPSTQPPAAALSSRWSPLGRRTNTTAAHRLACQASRMGRCSRAVMHHHIQYSTDVVSDTERKADTPLIYSLFIHSLHRFVHSFISIHSAYLHHHVQHLLLLHMRILRLQTAVGAVAVPASISHWNHWIRISAGCGVACVWGGYKSLA